MRALCFSCEKLPQKYIDGLCERCNAVVVHESKRKTTRVAIEALTSPGAETYLEAAHE